MTLLEEADGRRYQAFATNTRVGQLAFLEARHRAYARVEDRLKAAKDTGRGRETTIEAPNARGGVGHFSYASGSSHHIFEIWRVRKVADHS